MYLWLISRNVSCPLSQILPGAQQLNIRELKVPKEHQIYLKHFLKGWGLEKVFQQTKTQVIECKEGAEP